MYSIGVEFVVSVNEMSAEEVVRVLNALGALARMQKNVLTSAEAIGTSATSFKLALCFSLSPGIMKTAKYA